MNAILQAKTATDGLSSRFTPEPYDRDRWLDVLLSRLAAGETVPHDGGEIRERLNEATFDVIVGAIERARPWLSARAEVLFYQEWIAANPGAPLLFAAWFNIGVALGRLGDKNNSVIAYHNALVLRSSFHAAAINLGLSLEAMGQTEAALETWQNALQPQDARTALLIQRGRLLERTGRLDEAEDVLGGLLVSDPHQPDVIHHWVHLRQKMCLWPAVAPARTGLSTPDLMRLCGPLGLLALTDDVELLHGNAAGWLERKILPMPTRLSPPGGYRHDRIRVGYISSDFHRHAMSYLIPEVFELHDRARFEVYGYCSTNEDGSYLRQRVMGAFDHLRIIRHLTDEDAAELIRRDEIDILIDLNGITDGTRLQLLRCRPAPVQATYLGFIGSVPLPELDYLFCDDFVIPPERHGAYSPAPLSIGPIYQANDTKRLIGPPLTRAEQNLPEDAFVFCCFSNHYKITEEMFAAWLAILQRTPGSVLWLSTDNQWSQRHLADAAGRAGVRPERLIFAPRTSAEMYTSRLRLADLFLDTFPYNAGTIASDAIRMNLPLLTRCGRSFSSRMAGSLLTAVGATDGIAGSIEAYVEKAVQFATDPAAYAAYRAHFAGDVWRETIGNVERFMEGYERALARIVLTPA
jgi:predicted O-linked N-acetylglucosamine transferase (SPINDLY family)